MAKYDDTIEAYGVRSKLAKTIPVVAPVHDNPPPLISAEELWEIALIEFESPDRRKSLWAKAFSEAECNNSIAKAKYLLWRFEELLNEKTGKFPSKKESSTPIGIEEEIFEPDKEKRISNFKEVWGALDVVDRELTSRLFGIYSSFLTEQQKIIVSSELNLSSSLWSALHKVIFSTALLCFAYRSGLNKFRLSQKKEEEARQLLLRVSALGNFIISEKLEIVINAMLDSLKKN